jgi:hypothetical protein
MLGRTSLRSYYQNHWTLYSPRDKPLVGVHPKSFVRPSVVNYTWSYTPCMEVDPRIVPKSHLQVASTLRRLDTPRAAYRATITWLEVVHFHAATLG